MKPEDRLLAALIMSSGKHITNEQGEVSIRISVDFLDEIRAENFVLIDEGIDPTNGIYRTYTLRRKAA